MKTGNLGRYLVSYTVFVLWVFYAASSMNVWGDIKRKRGNEYLLSIDVIRIRKERDLKNSRSLKRLGTIKPMAQTYDLRRGRFFTLTIYLGLIHMSWKEESSSWWSVAGSQSWYDAPWNKRDNYKDNWNQKERTNEKDQNWTWKEGWYGRDYNPKEGSAWESEQRIEGTAEVEGENENPGSWTETKEEDASVRRDEEEGNQVRVSPGGRCVICCA